MYAVVVMFEGVRLVVIGRTSKRKIVMKGWFWSRS